jgi:hypothetical protein
MDGRRLVAGARLHYSPLLLSLLLKVVVTPALIARLPWRGDAGATG